MEIDVFELVDNRLETPGDCILSERNVHNSLLYTNEVKSPLRGLITKLNLHCGG